MAEAELLNALLLNGHIPATVLDEIAVLLRVDIAAGDGSHSSRSWTRRLKRNVAMPSLYSAKIPTASGGRLHPFRLPSVKARELWQRDAQYFQMKHQGVPGRVKTSGNWRAHPLFKEAGLRAAPVTMYGDGVQYVVNKFGKQDSLMCLYFAFPHRLPAEGEDGDGGWLDHINVFTVIRKQDICEETFDAIWDVLVWDAKAMLAGNFAQERHDGKPFSKGDYLSAMRGQPIAAGVRFAVIQLKQDWEYLCVVYGLKTWAAKEFCPFCDAPRDPRAWICNGARSEWRTTIWDHSRFVSALRGEVRLPDGSVSTKVKWTSRLWGVPHLLFSYVKADPMHVLYTDGVFNKTMGCLLYQMTVARKDLPGRTIEARVAAAWGVIRDYFHPKAPPIKTLLVKTFRQDGRDMRPAVQHLVQTRSASETEKQLAGHLGQLNELMCLHHVDETSAQRWLAAEINYLSLYIEAGFPTVPKHHMLQHIFMQFHGDCAPRYSYCFAEESKNAKMAELAQKACNKAGLAERVLLMHELWAATGGTTVSLIKRRRLSKRPAACMDRLRAADADVHVDVSSGSGVDVAVSSGSEADVDVA